jgi:hypothetical protein
MAIVKESLQVDTSSQPEQMPAGSSVPRTGVSRDHQVSIVMNQACPRCVYSIGLMDTIGSELILAGALYFNNKDGTRILNTVAQRLRAGATPNSIFDVEGLGSFTLWNVRDDWLRQLMPEAVSYYANRYVTAYQILPDKYHWTIDIPAMDIPVVDKTWNAAMNRAWRWLREEWPYDVPRNSVATTNLAALRGGYDHGGDALGGR